MEPIWRKAEELGVRILTDPDWTVEDGAWFGEFESHGPWILMPGSIPLRLERWYLGHELQHYLEPALIGNTWLSEARADRRAVKMLLEMYDVDQVAWPQRVWHLLPHWEEIAA